MKSENIWLRGSRARIMNESSDGRGLDIGFDPKIPPEQDVEEILEAYLLYRKQNTDPQTN